jgi:uncharacterized repeat protein (TIGR02543 family)
LPLWGGSTILEGFEMKKCGTILIAAMALLALVFTGCPNGTTDDVEKVTITFNLGGATGTAPAAIEIAKGTAAGGLFPANPTWAGHTFTGWFNGTTVYTKDTVINASVTLTAHWSTAETVTVTFSLGDVTGTAPAAITITKGQAAGSQFPVNPTAAGKAFTGWFYETTEYTKDTVINASVTLTAQWETVPPVAVTFKNGETVVATKSEVQVNSAIGIENMPDFPSDSGKTFAGWKDEDNKAFTGTTIVTSALTLSAQWLETPLLSTLAIDASTGTNGGINGTISDLPNSSGLGFVTTIPLTGATVAEGERLQISFNITGAANFHQVQIAASVDNYAYHSEADPWGNNGYDNGAERSATITATSEAAEDLAIQISVKQGYNGVAVGDIVAVTITDLKVTKQAVAINRTVTFDANGGGGETATVTVLDGQKVAAGDIPQFTAPANEAFKWWNTASDGSGTTYVDNNALTALTITADTTFYAIWDRDPIVTNLKGTGNSAINKNALENVYGHADGILVMTVTAPATGDTQKGGIGGICIGTTNYSTVTFSYNSPAGIANSETCEFKILVSELLAAINTADGIFVNFYNDYNLTKVDMYTYATDPAPAFGLQDDGTYKLNPALFASWYGASIAGNTISFTGGGVDYPFPADLDISGYSKLVVDYTTSGVNYVEGNFLQITVLKLKGSSGSYTRDNVDYPVLAYGSGTFEVDSTKFDMLKEADAVGFTFQVNNTGNENTYSMQINSMVLEP